MAAKKSKKLTQETDKKPKDVAKTEVATKTATKAAKKVSEKDPQKEAALLSAVAANAGVPCLPEQTVRGIVQGCLPAPANDDQTLGQLFPMANKRNQFCTCVRGGLSAAGMSDPNVPCSATTTIGEVVEAASC